MRRPSRIGQLSAPASLRPFGPTLSLREPAILNYGLMDTSAASSFSRGRSPHDAAHDRFFLQADDTALVGDGADATRLVFKVVDKFGAERAFAGGTVAFTLSGPGVIVGDNPFSLVDSGGVGAVWIRTLPRRSGRITVKAVHSFLGGRVRRHQRDCSEDRLIFT